MADSQWLVGVMADRADRCQEFPPFLPSLAALSAPLDLSGGAEIYRQHRVRIISFFALRISLRPRRPEIARLAVSGTC